MTENAQNPNHGHVAMTVQLVAALVGRNPTRVDELPGIIRAVHGEVGRLLQPEPNVVDVLAPMPAVPIKKSLTPDFLICLDDGKKFKSLKRHLSSLGMTPAEYRAKWGLPADYPMVAPGYAAKRSELAKAQGLGKSAVAA